MIKHALLPACTFLSLLMGASLSAEEIRFVVFGDTQLGKPEQFERMVHEAELLRPQFVVHVGDMIHGYTDNREQLHQEWNQFQKQIEPLSVPFFPVPGNHDVGTTEAQEVYQDYWGDDRFFYSFDRGNVRCIVLATYLNGTKDRVSKEQRLWLQKELDSFVEAHGGADSEQLDSTSIILFLHSPFWRYRADEAEAIDEWESIHQMLLDYPVRMVIAGQTDREHEYVWEQRDGIDYVVVASSASMPQDNERAGFFHSFLHLSVVGDDIRTAVIKPGSILPMDTVNVEERNRVATYGLRSGTLRLESTGGNSIDEIISLPIINNVDHARSYELDWEIPRHSMAVVTPNSRWIDLEPGEETTADFRLRTPTQFPQDKLPSLTIKTSSLLRSGTLSRQWEERYREGKSSTSIPLDQHFEFQATYSLYIPPEVKAVRRLDTITLDGLVEEEAWNPAPPLEDFKQGDDRVTAPVKTSVRFLYDDDYLYVGARLEEPSTALLKADAGGEIALTWNDDDFELFFDPQASGMDHTRIFENSAGTRFTSKPLHHPNRYAPMDYESAIHVGDDYWSLEFRIPWSDIAEASPPSPGDRWAINVWRHRQQSDPARFSWAVNAYDQGRYGQLHFE